tara:strand:+ start:3571 stop:3810 length:240 start_codon:yes stop_codon:yes gene_type:complete
MKFETIIEGSKIFPGEYLLYEPSMAIVVCGAFNRKENFIRCLGNGKIIKDSIDKFKKIKLSVTEQKERKYTRCKGCSDK